MPSDPHRWYRNGLRRAGFSRCSGGSCCSGWPGWLMGFVGVESEVERRAFACLALGPHAAAVPCHDLPDAGQADTRAWELAGRMQPLERLEQHAHVNGVKADTVVAHVTADGGI